MKNQKTNPKLTPAKKKFAQVYAQTDNASEAVRQAFPHLAKNSSQKTIQNKGSRLLSNAIVARDIEQQKKQMEAIASKAVNKIEEIIDTGNERNALTASMYTYDHVHGKATQSIRKTGSHVFISYDLSGGSAGPVPQEILDQLA